MAKISYSNGYKGYTFLREIQIFFYNYINIK